MASTATFADTYLINTIPFAGSANVIAGATLSAIIDAAIGSTQGDILYRGAAVWSVLAPGSAGALLAAGGPAANPAWTTATFPITAGATGTILRSNGTNWVPSTATFADTYAVSTILYASASNVVTGLAAAQNGVLVSGNTNIPAMLAGPGTTGNIFQSNAAAAPSFSTATYPSVATGTGTMLRANGTNWVASTATFADTYVINSIPYASAANTITALAPALSSVLISSAASTGVPAWSGALGDGQMIIGSAGATPVVGSISVSGNLSRTLGAGTFALSLTGPASFSWE